MRKGIPELVAWVIVILAGYGLYDIVITIIRAFSALIRGSAF